MKIGEVIRKYRKEKQITQEMMARILGVTAPAVNKWENGNSCPDVALLAPIARLLGIRTDTLLSYQEELTELEIQMLTEEMSIAIKKGDYEQAFTQGMNKVREYPNCSKLILLVAQILYGNYYMMNVTDTKQYEKTIIELYMRLLDSPDLNEMQAAAAALFHHALEKREYEEAEQFLNRIPKQNYDPDKLRANLCAQQGKLEEAYQLYEQQLLFSYQKMTWALQGLSHLAIQEEAWNKAEMLAKKQGALAELLEMGLYMQAASELELACVQKDTERVVSILFQLVEGVTDLYRFPNSELFCHMKFGNSGTEMLMIMLKNALEADTELEFLRKDERYQVLLEKLNVNVPDL